MKNSGPSFLTLGLDLRDRERTKARRDQAEREEELEPIPDPTEGIDPYQRGMVSLDLAIDRNTGRPYVFEIQGWDAGIKGIQHVEGHEVLKHKAKQFRLARDGGDTNDPAKQKISFRNPRYIEEIFDSKALQAQVHAVPEKYEPDTIDGTASAQEFQSFCQKHSRIIIKPHNQARGIGIEAFNTATQEERNRAWEYAKQVKNTYDDFVAQEFIEPAGAAAAPEDLKDHYAVMRFVVLFDKDQSGRIHIVEKIGYWRVSPYHHNQIGEHIRGRQVSDSDASVVNLDRGAGAVVLTPEEERMATVVANDVIEQLTVACKNTPRYKRQRGERLREAIRGIENELYDRYGVSLIWSNLTDEERISEEQYRFLYRLRKELSRVAHATWNARVMKGWNRHRNIVRIPDASGKLRGKITLSHQRGFLSGNIIETPYEFSVETPGELRRILEQFVRDHH